jgi:acetyltransferase-like isoleucine patch superfamily enzyme
VKLFRIVTSVYRQLRRWHERGRYNPYTIASYFRVLGTQIGDGCYIVPQDLGTEPYLIKIGNHVAVLSEVEFVTHDGAVWIFRDQVPDLQVFGPIVIGDNCIIGSRTTIFPNVRIGSNSVVASGSLVINDVVANSFVMGVPARPFGTMEQYRQRCLERWAQQRPVDPTAGHGNNWWYSNQKADREKQRRHLLQAFHDRLNSEATTDTGRS